MAMNLVLELWFSDGLREKGVSSRAHPVWYRLGL